ncbi:MAG TPA: gluconokinase, partial [Burkholderiales bacterium]|nr:gluconokinase [Burkholderiales bacterium]
AILACSALKATYRERLAQGIEDFTTVYLDGDFALINQRMKSRRHRYMPAALLESQFAALEPPADAIAIDVAATPDDCVAAIVARLTERRTSGSA